MAGLLLTLAPAVCPLALTPSRKEALWPYVREFADNALAHASATLARLAAAGEMCELYAVHGERGCLGWGLGGGLGWGGLALGLAVGQQPQ
jgi:hypothetical protein